MPGRDFAAGRPDPRRRMEKEKETTDSEGFEPSSKAPQALRISKLPHESKCISLVLRASLPPAEGGPRQYQESATMSQYKNESARTAGLKRQIRNALARIGPQNRPHAERELRRRRNKDQAASTRLNVVLALAAFDRALAGRDLASAGAENLAAGLARLNSEVGPASAGTYMVHVRATLKELHNTDKLARDVRSATDAPDVPTFRDGLVIPNEDFHRLLEVIQSDRPRLGVFDTRLEQTAIAWCLRDAGPRARELLACEVRGIVLKPDGTGLLCLPTKPELQDMLKTGPRDIPIKDAVGPLRAWLDAHPAQGNPDAPLFCGFRSRTGLARLGYNTLWKTVKRWGDESGLNAQDAKARTLRPHDFRHTCATMKVEVNSWQEQQLCAFFGWAAGSKMPARYVHLSTEALRRRVLEDAGINDLGYRTTQPSPADELSQLKNLMRKLLQD